MGRRSKEHLAAQRAGKKRDRHVCQICGSTNHTEGHHMIDHQYGGGASKDNIITLCHECHQKAHKGLLDLLFF